MTSTIPPARRIQLLLNTLAGERYVRGPLLRELVDELIESDRPEAVRAGRELLERLDSGLDEGEYETRLAHIVELARPARRAALYGEAAE